MNMCTSWWHTSARCYTLLAFCRFAPGAPTSAPIGTSQWSPSLGLEHICEDCLHMHPILRGVRPQFISKPILDLRCVKFASFFVSYSPFGLIYMTKLWPFWKFLWEGLLKIWTTWCFSCHTFIRFPIGTCMTPNIQKCKLKIAQWHSSHFQRWWHPQTHHPQSTHLFGSAVAHAWVYNLMCIPLLTFLPSKREMHTLLEMCWIV